MADANSAWMDNWLNSQQGYWKAWSDMAQSGMKAPEMAQMQMPKMPWTEGLDQWWKTVSHMAPPDGRAMFDKLMDASRGYFAMAEKFTQSAGKKPGLDTLNSIFEQAQKGWQDLLSGATTQRPKDTMAFWDLPLDTWQRFAANIVPMPGDFTQAFHPDSTHRHAEAVRGQVNNFLSIPAVGYTRESQEQSQSLVRLMGDYAAAMQAYQAAFGNLAMETGQEFQAAVQAMAQKGESLDSLRAIYDMWVDMSETAYARFVMTEKYQALYGNLVNSLMAVKQQGARMVDQSLEAMHMPTHAEIDTLQFRQQEQRRENLRLRKELKETRLELANLRQTVEALAEAVARKPAEKPVTKPVEVVPAPAKPAAMPVAAKTAAPAKPAAKVAAKPAAKPAAAKQPAAAAKPAARKAK